VKIAPRELVLLVATIFIALFGGTAILARARIDAWRDIVEKQDAVRVEIEKSSRLIQARELWAGKFEEHGKKIPQFPAEKQMDVHWLALMDDIAAKRGLTIAKRMVGKEKQVGAVYELPIEVQEWDGSLDAITYFMFDLQAAGAMMDLRQLYIKPKEDRSLRGRFTLYCAYTRADALTGM
jgi:Tfp pilus assembly protein PilO